MIYDGVRWTYMQIETFGDYYELLRVLTVNHVIIYYIAGYFSLSLAEAALGTEIDTSGKFKKSTKILLSLMLVYFINSLRLYFIDTLAFSELEVLATVVLLLIAVLWRGRSLHLLLSNWIYRIAIKININRSAVGLSARELKDNMRTDIIEQRSQGFTEVREYRSNILIIEAIALILLLTQAFYYSSHLGTLIAVAACVHIYHRIELVKDLIHEPLVENANRYYKDPNS